MAFVSGTTGNEAAQRFLEVLQNDFKNLGQETKKKYPQIKEVSCVRSPLRCIDVRNATNPSLFIYLQLGQIQSIFLFLLSYYDTHTRAGQDV